MEEISDKLLLEIYMNGFSDYLDGKHRTYKAKIKKRAYNLGKMDAIYGDDVPSIDLQSKETVLRRIRLDFIK